MKYFEVHVLMTGKAVNSKDGFSIYHEEVEKFKFISEVKDFLKEKYGSCSREKMYRDDKNGKSFHSGYIYKLGLQEPTERGEKKWYGQDWVEVREIQSTTIII